ncbi:hypothetical protein OsJ_28551 [Oryza sativa Japonica Group]|uniref:Uncharacterized protein n=1 Tax=Oryza sativa subsp. japonica TaxID=39947 RepID=B9G2D5_ORYSJ|nr:hypothetical protein OsJ_28551 [Oryza sativa Japonica Group]
MLASSLQAMPHPPRPRQPQPALHVELRQLHRPPCHKRRRTRLAQGRFLGTSVVDVTTLRGSPLPPPRATPPAARGNVVSPLRRDMANPSARHGNQTAAATRWPPPPTNAMRSHLRVDCS